MGVSSDTISSYVNTACTDTPRNYYTAVSHIREIVVECLIIDQYSAEKHFKYDVYSFYNLCLGYFYPDHRTIFLRFSIRFLDIAGNGGLRNMCLKFIRLSYDFLL